MHSESLEGQIGELKAMAACRLAIAPLPGYYPQTFLRSCFELAKEGAFWMFCGRIVDVRNFWRGCSIFFGDFSMFFMDALLSYTL